MQNFSFETKAFFHTANLELKKVFKRLNTNKLSLNTDKTKYAPSHIVPKRSDSITISTIICKL